MLAAISADRQALPCKWSSARLGCSTANGRRPTGTTSSRCAASIPRCANWRIVADRGVITTTGITASMPMSLTLIEARSRAVTFSPLEGAQQTRNGIRVLPDRVAASWPVERLLPAIGDRQPARALDEALDAINARYGMRTANFVAMQLEYPGPYIESR